LAAGYATRLYPLTKRYPKPLLEVGGKPIIDYIIAKLDGLKGIEEIIVVTNSKFVSYFRGWAKGKIGRKPIRVVDDLTSTLSDRRGAIGDINFVLAKEKIKTGLLVIGGDNLFDADLKGFIDFTRRHRASPVIGLYDIKKLSLAGKYGVAKIDKKARIIDFKEKPDRPDSTLVAMCLYYFPKEILGLIREYISLNYHAQDATGLYIDWLRKNVAVYGFRFTKQWYDIGDHKFYNEAQRVFSCHKK